MTVLNAYDQTDLTSYNLNYFYANTDFEEFNPGAFQDGYADNYHLYEGQDSLSLYGYDFSRNLGGDMVNGTIEAIGQWGWVEDLSLTDEGYWNERWHWSGWNYDMADFFAAASTPDLNDDWSLIKGILSGADTIKLSNLDDAMQGFKGNDIMIGRDGDDILYGNNGLDELFGGLGADELHGGRGGDKLSGGQGADIMDGGIGGDFLYGGLGNDVMTGGSGAGTDVLNGNKGKDDLDGGRGNDILNGGGGEDTLRGGKGADVLTGGKRVDTFVFMTGDDEDIITDFDAKGVVHDVLNLGGLASIDDFQDLSQNHMFQDGNDVLIAGNNGDSILLLDVSLADLDQGDFSFTL